MKEFTLRNLILLSFFISCLCSSAQVVVYTDVDPDSTVSANLGSSVPANFYVDLDQNSAPDFVIAHWNLSAILKTVSIECYLNHGVIVDASNRPKVLNLNDPIAPSSATWYDPSAPVVLNQTTSTDTIGNWQNVTDKYVGVRLESLGEYFYGWIRLDVPALPTSFTIKDYACRTAAGVGIAAGDITGIAEAEPDRYHIIVTPGSLIVEFLDPGISQGVINILNITGQTVYSGTLNGERTTISGLNLTKGVYFIYLYFNGKAHTAKIWYR